MKACAQTPAMQQSDPQELAAQSISQALKGTIHGQHVILHVILHV